MQKALLFLGLFLALGTTGAFAQFAVTEDFRGGGNPDIIIGDQATLTSGNVDPVNQGWLRLTTNETYKKGHAYINKSFPSSLGVLVDFEYKIWRDTNDGFNGADGIGVFLFDGNVTQSQFTLGAYGGSLGYVGLRGGYVGIGIDEYGNFANPNDGGKRGGPLGNGVEAFRPNSIVMRGPTTTNNTDNVVGGVQPTNRYLSGRTIRATTNAGVTTYTYNDIVTNTGVGTENAIDYNTTTTTRPADATFYRRIQIEIKRITTGGEYEIIVRWKTNSVATTQFVEITRYTTTDIPPGLLKLGFAASTGGGINYHEIRNLLTTTPNNMRVIKRANKDWLRGVTNNGSNASTTENQVQYTIEITNDTGMQADNIKFEDYLTDANGAIVPFVANNTTAGGFFIESIVATGFLGNPTSASFIRTPNSAGKISHNTLSMAANTTAFVTITGRLTSVPSGNLLVNTATVTPMYDTDMNNNTSVVQIPIIAEGTDVIPWHTVDEACSDGSNTFTLIASNTGTDAVTVGNGNNSNRLRMVITIPTSTGFGYTANNINGWDYTGVNDNGNGTSSFTFNSNQSVTLAAGAVYNFPIVYTITKTGNTAYSSTAVISYRNSNGNQIEPSGAARNNNTAIVSINSIPIAPTVSNVYYCQGATALPLTATKSNSAYDLKWYFSASGGFSSDFAPVPSTENANAQSYWVSQVNGTCEGPRSKIDVFISSTPTAGAIAANQNICSGATASTITSQTDGTIGLGAISYRWEQSVNGGAWGTIANATASTYAPGVLTSTTAYRRYTVSKNGTGTTSPAGSNCESSATSPVTITVSAVPAPGTLTADQSLCYNTAAAAITTASGAANAPTGTGTLTYKWESATATGSFTVINNVSTESYTPPGNNTVTMRYRRSTIATNGTAICTSGVSNIVTVYVQGVVNAGGIAAAQTICPGATPTALTSTSPGSSPTTDAVITYRWESSTNAGGTWGTAAGTATNIGYAPGALSQTTYFRRVTISTYMGKACEAISGNVIITVALPTAGTITADQIICRDSAPSQLTSASGGSGSGAGSPNTYQWYSSNDPVNNFNPINGATSENYQPGILTGTTYYSRTTKTTTNGTTCESAKSNAVKITVVQFPTPGQLTNADKYACYNTAPTEIVSNGAGTATDGAVISYVWQQTTDVNNTVWSGDIPNATAANYTPGPLTQTTSFRRFTIATYPNAQCRSTSATNVVKVNVSVVPTSGSIKSDQVVCSGSTPANIVNDQQGTGSSGLTYLWQTSINNVDWTNASGVNPDFQTSAITQTTYYRRFGISNNGGAICYATVPSNVVTVTVPVTTGGTIAAAQTICSGGTPALLTSASGGAATGANIKYSWQVFTSGSWVNINGATSETYQPGALIATTQYRRVATSTATNGSNCSSANSNAITITVTAAVTAGTVAANQVICYNTIPTPLTSTGAGATTNYRWDSSTDGNTWSTTGVTTAGYTFPAPLVATRYYRRATLSGSCEGYTATITITVLAETNAGSISGDQNICMDNAPATIGPGTAGSGAGTVTYKWEMSTNNGASWDVIAGANQPSYQPPVIRKTTRYRRTTVSTSVIGGLTYICESATTAGTVIVTARNCKVITNPMIYQKVKN